MYAGQLNQVFMNILVNAIDAIPQAITEELGQDTKHEVRPLHRQFGGAEPSTDQASLLPHAWLWRIRGCPTVLPSRR